MNIKEQLKQFSNYELKCLLESIERYIHSNKDLKTSGFQDLIELKVLITDEIITRK